MGGSGVPGFKRSSAQEKNWTTRDEQVTRDKRYQSEQVVNLLRQIEVVLANGKMTPALQGSWDNGADVLPVAQDACGYDTGV